MLCCLLVVLGMLKTNTYSQKTTLEPGEYEKATTVYKKLYEKSPFNTTYLQRLISCYQETTQFVRAEELLKAKIQSNLHKFFYMCTWATITNDSNRKKQQPFITKRRSRN